MWIKINYTLWLCLHLAVKNANALILKSTYNIFCESIFQSQCPFLITDENKNECAFSLYNSILQVSCRNQEIDTPDFSGSFAFDDNQILLMSCIKGLEGLGTLLDTTQCNKSQQEYKRIIFKNCNKSDITFIEIKSFPKYMTKIGYLDLLASSFPNVNHINWSYCDECMSLNQFLIKFKYLNRLNMFLCKNLIGCQGYNLANVTQIEKILIVLGPYKMDDSKNISLLNETRLKGLTNLKEFELRFPTNGYVVEIPSELFKGLKNLASLIFINCSISQLTENHFQDLINLKTLTIKGGSVNGSDWLKSSIIQDNLMSLELDKGVNLSDSKISAFICQDENFCNFNFDINKKQCPKDCMCFLWRATWQFVIRCKTDKIPELPIPINGTSCLVMENVNLTQLPNLTIYGHSNLNEVKLINNKLTSLTVDQLPTNLTYLDLRNNSLHSFDSKVIEFLSSRTMIIQLSGNPWICNCDTVQMLDFIANGSNNIIDRLDLKCSDRKSGYPMSLYKTDNCRSYLQYYILGYLLLLAVLVIIALYTKQSISMWLYERNLCLNWIAKPEPKVDTALRIDAFLAFSHVDLELIDEFVEKLEKGPREYKLRFYQRDWLIGESIPDCILQSIEYSKRVIILMTDNFIKSSWGLFEFRSAIKATSMDKNKRLIVILYPGVDIDKLDSELKLYMKFNTYLRRDDPLFWRKLMFAMPHKQVITKEPTQLECPAIEECQL